MRYFEKQLPNLAFYFADGSPPEYAARSAGSGLIALDESQQPEKVAELEKLARQRVGGIVALSAEQFDAKKKAISLLTLTAPATPPKLRAVRPDQNPFLDALEGRARPAAVMATAKPVAARESPAQPAAAPAAPDNPQPARQRYQPRAGTLSKERAESPAPSQ